MRFADAHIHLFREGYHRPGLPSLFGDRELQAYEALRLTHGVDLALAIGYEAEGIGPANNAYLRQLSHSRSWLSTLAFVETTPPPEPGTIEAVLEAGHAGLAIYAQDRPDAESVLRWSPACWRLLQSRKAIVSFNSRPEAISVLGRLIAESAGVQFLFSHLGLPGVLGPDMPEALRDRLKPLLSLARLPNVHVKISGAYATSVPQHAFPHRGGERCDWENSRSLWAGSMPVGVGFPAGAGIRVLSSDHGMAGNEHALGN